MIPANKLNNTLRTEFKLNNWLEKGYASLKLESVFNQKKINTFETNTKGYNLLHISLGGKIKFNNVKFDLNLNVNNLFDTAYISHLSWFKNEGVQNIGRNIMLGVDFDI